MNGLTGSSFYDCLNKLAIGFLLLLPFLVNSEVFNSPDSFQFVVLAFCSWITGLFFWGLSNLLFHAISKCTPYYKTNNLDWINHEYTDISKKICDRYMNSKGVLPDSLELYDYYSMYYDVQKQGLLGAVPQLECFSAFFRNFTMVLMLWILVILTRLWHPFTPDYYTPEEMTIAIIIILILWIISLILRYYTEKKIFQTIFEAYFLSKKESQK